MRVLIFLFFFETKNGLKFHPGIPTQIIQIYKKNEEQRRKIIK
jgi:hypothetical protein